MEVKFLVPARAELVEAVAYYESRKEGRGSQFAAEVKRTIQRILQYPEAWSAISEAHPTVSYQQVPVWDHLSSSWGGSIDRRCHAPSS